MFQLVTVLLFMIAGTRICVVDATYMIVLDEKFEDCGHSGFIDWSEMKIIPFNDTHLFLDGKVTFLKKVQSPWGLNIQSERFSQGKWVLGEINRKVPDFCAVIQSEKEPWYLVSSKFQQKTCPYSAGAVLTFNMVQLNNFNFYVPPTFRGKWRLSLDMLFIDGKKKATECNRYPFEVIEI